MSTVVYVYMQGSGGGSWSRYLFDYDITEFAQLDNTLYVRHTIDGVDAVSIVVEDKVSDDYTTADGLQIVYFDGLVQWPWLDYGAPSQTKMFEAFDVIATQNAQISFFYDERQPAIETPAYQLNVEDTIPGFPIPYPFASPAFGPAVRFVSDEDSSPWELLSLNMIFHDFGPGR